MLDEEPKVAKPRLVSSNAPPMSAARRFETVFSDEPRPAATSQTPANAAPRSFGTVKARFESLDWDGNGGIDEHAAQQKAVHRAEHLTLRNFFKDIKW